jgi:AcrR family transcriptional regulator
MPKLWDVSIEAHRREVRDAILDTTATLAAEHGVLSVRMSQIAEATGIGRATLYKYFPDVEAILRAWHERQIAQHLAQLTDIARGDGDATQRLDAVLFAYARITHASHGHDNVELTAFLHGDQQVHHAQQQLRALIGDLIAEGAESGAVRDDIAPHELASFCLGALGTASTLPSKASVQRLVNFTMAGLRRRSRP